MKTLTYKGLNSDRLAVNNSITHSKSPESKDLTQSSFMKQATKNRLITPRQILPSLHKKTHFKAATTLFMNTTQTGVLNFYKNNDAVVNIILQDLNQIAVRKGLTTSHQSNSLANHNQNSSA